MNNHLQRMAAARQLAATTPTPNPPNQAAPTSADANDGSEQHVDPKIHTNGVAMEIPQPHPLPPGGHIQDYDPNRSRNQLGGGYPEFQQVGAANARPHNPEGSATVRSHVGIPARQNQNHIRDHVAGSSITDARHHIQDAMPVPRPGQQQPPPVMTPQMLRAQMTQQPPMQPPIAGQMQPQMQQQVPGQVPAHMQPQMPQQVPGQVPAHMQPQMPQQVPGQPAGARPQLPGSYVPMAVGPTAENQNVASVTVIIATFRRPQYFRYQLQALADQTVRPADLWVWANDSVAGAQLHDNEAESAYTVIRSKPNLGPWVRFTIAEEVLTKYVLILDDDCVPGPKWLEAAILRLEQLETQGETAVICAEGRMFGGDNPEQFIHLGPTTVPLVDEAFVDEGLKGWLIPRALFDAIRAVPRSPSPVGWGFHIGAALQQAGFYQIVLPYTEEGKETWGSIPIPGSDEAQPSVSVSATLPGYAEARQVAWSFYRQVCGWTPMALLPENGLPEEPSSPSDDSATEGPSATDGSGETGTIPQQPWSLESSTDSPE
jgi:hypothetical protein